jgi:hypothetical protein
MSAKKILTVGIELASSDTQYASFTSKLSLLDWDIILFKPHISGFFSYTEYYKGKPSLGDSQSFELKDCCEHWRREIKQALEAGKTVIVYLSELKEVYVDTGQRSYSGTGRNRQTTRIVAPYNNYQAIPANVSPVATTGSSMKLAGKGADILAPYWAEFEDSSKYQVLLTAPNVPTCITTRTGDGTVGALFRSKASSGTLLLLPDIDFEDDRFTKEKEDGVIWTRAAHQFAGRFVTSIVALDKALRTTSDVTPEPPWAADHRYVLGPEVTLRVELLEAERKVEQAQKEKEAVVERLASVGQFRALLFEKGKPLERIIIDALHLLGFKAAPFKETGSEFDVVFECAEGRLIGEVEGKDNKAINIDKLRQLSMNIHEDLQRDEVSAPAKPVLFGNAFRLQPVQERTDPFTEKCHSAAAISNTALVSTPDLFAVIQHLTGQPDLDFARMCRLALLEFTGRVVFPVIPTPEPQPIEMQVEEAK